MPTSVDGLTELLHATFARIVGVDLRHTDESWVYRAQFNHGGMSGGGINLHTWHQRLMPLLVERGAYVIDRDS